MISFKSSFENTNVVLPNPNIFLWMAGSVADTAAINSNGSLANVQKSPCFIKGDPIFSNGPRSLHT